MVLAAASAGADVVVLVNGDQITGRVVGSVTKRVRLQTPYGVLLIPSEKVERIKHDDGSEELVRPAPAPQPTPTPPPASATLLLVVTGASFWHAWDPKLAPQDPSLRLELRLDERVLATYTDVNLDPEDLPKAVVNSFVFSPERLFVSGAEGVAAAVPSLAESEIRLEIRVPASLAGERRLRLAYQLNDAGSAAPRWRDVVVGGAPVTLVAGRSVRVRVAQDRGTMEYTRKGLRGQGLMRGVETFRATPEVEQAP
jgi:hypothetical protein